MQPLIVAFSDKSSAHKLRRARRNRGHSNCA
jgi:hypothetical protein